MGSGEVVRVGVIGRGFGLRMVAPVFEETDGCEVVDVVSPRDEAAVGQLCARPDVDLISIHSPPFMHVDHVRRAFDAGHAVLCDKPFGRTAEEAAEMCELADRSGAVGLLNFEMRFDPVQERLRAMALDGSIGRPEHFACTTYLAISRNPLRPYGWLFDAGLGGGWIGAWGSHIVDFLRWSFGEVTEVSSQTRTAVDERPDRDGKPQRCSAEDGFTAALTMASGVTAAIDSTFAGPVNLPPRTIVLGSEGMLEIGAGGVLTRHDSSGGQEEVAAGAPGDLKTPMRRWAAVVRDSVRAGRPEPGAPTFADGLACRQVLDRLRTA